MSVFASLLWFLAVCSGLMSGIYLTYFLVSAISLAGIESGGTVDTMNVISRAIAHPSFMPVFFVTTVLAFLLVMSGLWHRGEPGTDRALWGALIYFMGMLLVTAMISAPWDIRRGINDGEDHEGHSKAACPLMFYR